MTSLPVTEPLYIEVDTPRGGRRFALHHRAAGGTRAAGLVVHVHPFGEELNKTRRMASLQARALASSGLAVLQMDLFGCGDSDGAFADATWADWVDDVVAATKWLLAREGSDAADTPLWLWGHRTGALLAAEAAVHLARPVNFLFWQPTAAGKAALQQQFRLKAAGDMLSGHGKTIVAAAKADLKAGKSIDVAGYTLQAGLCSGLESAQLLPPPARPSSLQPPRVEWIDLASSADAELSPLSERQAARWRDAGWTVNTQIVSGPAFWHTVDIEEAPALVAASVKALSGCLPDAAPAGAAEPPAAVAVTPGATQALSFGCAGETLIGVLHHAVPPRAASGLGLLVVVGGPQYRIGSHRQFVELAQVVAAAGTPVLRFDVRGMGDSSGPARSFEEVSDDIAAAIGALQKHAPSVRQVVLWGLCDGASAALLYLQERQDPRVHGVALANPWVRSAVSQARTQVKHYYTRRFREPAFWRKLFSGAVSPRAIGEWFGALRTARGNGNGHADSGTGRAASRPGASHSGSFQDRMLDGWTRRPRPALVLLSGDDYTAREFVEHAQLHPGWQAALAGAQTERHELVDADHTFSNPSASHAVASLTADWLATQRAPRALASPNGKPKLD